MWGEIGEQRLDDREGLLAVLGGGGVAGDLLRPGELHEQEREVLPKRGASAGRCSGGRLVERVASPLDPTLEASARGVEVAASAVEGGEADIGGDAGDIGDCAGEVRSDVTRS